MENKNEESWGRLRDFLARNRLKMTEEQEQIGAEAFGGEMDFDLEREHEKQLKFLFHPSNHNRFNNNDNPDDNVD